MRHEGWRARDGASMMRPDYTHWHGMYGISKHYYLEFLPAVFEAAEAKSPSSGAKYKRRMDTLVTAEEHRWIKGPGPAKAEAPRKTCEERYGQ